MGVYHFLTQTIINDQLDNCNLINIFTPHQLISPHAMLRALAVEAHARLCLARGSPGSDKVDLIRVSGILGNLRLPW